jgi:hypothetical protein
MERGFWILLVERGDPRSPEAAGFVPFFEMSLMHSEESLLPVFSSEEKALAFAKHVGEQHAGRVPTAIRLSQTEIQERAFRGNPQGRCVVDPTPDHPGREVTVNDLHTVAN